MPRLLVIEKRHQAAQVLIERRFAGGLSIQSETSVKAGLDNHQLNPFALIVWDTVSSPAECVNPVHHHKKISSKPLQYQNDRTI